VIVVVGLEFEARIAAGAGMRVICSGEALPVDAFRAAVKPRA